MVVALKIRSNSRIFKEEKERLLNEIEELSKTAHVRGEEAKIHPLDKDKIESQINAKLNDSDWAIIMALYEEPAIDNRLLSEKVFLSYEGVRSSLKKMYGLFELSGGGKLMRFELLRLALKYSSSSAE